MAKTAAMSVSTSTPKAEQVLTATCTVTNNDAAAINVTAVVPSITPTGGTRQDVAASSGMPPVGGAFTSSVAASGGTLVISWPVVAHAPVTSYGILAEPSSQQLDVGALVYLSDGTSISATVATITVAYPSN